MIAVCCKNNDKKKIKPTRIPVSPLQWTVFTWAWRATFTSVWLHGGEKCFSCVLFEANSDLKTNIIGKSSGYIWFDKIIYYFNRTINYKGLNINKWIQAELLLCICDSRFGYMTEFWDCRGKKKKPISNDRRLTFKEAVMHGEKKHFTFTPSSVTAQRFPVHQATLPLTARCAHRSWRTRWRVGPLTSLFCCVCCHLHLRFRASFSTPRSISTYRDFRSIRSRSWKPHIPVPTKHKNQLSHNRENCVTPWWERMWGRHFLKSARQAMRLSSGGTKGASSNSAAHYQFSCRGLQCGPQRSPECAWQRFKTQLSLWRTMALS